MRQRTLRPYATIAEVIVLVSLLASGSRATFGAASSAPLKDEMRMPWQRASEAAFIREWLVCGEFPNPPVASSNPAAPLRVGHMTDYLLEHGGESQICPVAGMSHTRPDGTKAEWKSYVSPYDTIYFPFALAGRPTEDVVAYAVTNIKRDEAGCAAVALSSDGGLKVWVNSRLTYDRAAYRRLRRDEEVFEVSLNKGDNFLLVKVDHGRGDWGFRLRVTNVAEGRRLAEGVLSPAIVTGGGADAGKLVVVTGQMLGSLDTARPPVRVDAIGPTGEVVACEAVPRGERVVFDTCSWSDGPYEVTCQMACADGRVMRADLPWYKGDPVAAAKVLVETAPQADQSTPEGMVHAMLAEIVMDRLEGKLEGVNATETASIHAPLMEFKELLNAQAGGRGGARPRGMVRLAYRDEVDGSPQFCRAYLPADYDPAKKWPMIVVLHGYNVSNPPYVKGWGSTVRHDEYADRHHVIMLHPHGRGNTSYRGIGERDVMRCIELAKQQLPVDENRVYLTGYSMGGGGTWHIGTRHPEQFAAIAPYFGGGDYHVSMDEEQLARLTPLERFRLEARSGFAQAEQLLNTPVWVMHGDADVLVNVAHSRYAVRMLQRWGYDVRYQEVPGLGHEDLYTEDVLYPWFLQHKRDPNPRRVRIRAAALKDASAYWVGIEQRKDPLAFVNADVEITAPNTIRLDSENVLEVTLSPGEPLVDRARALRIVWNGAEPVEVPVGPDGRVTLRAAGYHPGLMVKTPELEGPISAAQTMPFAIVVGTTSPDPTMRRVCELRARSIARAWETWQHWPPRLFRDAEISDADVQAYTLILVGGPDANLITKRLIKHLPLRVSSDEITIDGRAFQARDSAVQVIYPHPLNPRRYVLILAATSPRGMYLAQDMPDDVDFCISDGHMPSSGEGQPDEKVYLAMGTFDHTWRLNAEYLFEGDPATRAECGVRKAPTLVSAAGEGDRLMLSALLESAAEGPFARMIRDANWSGTPMTLAGTTYASGIAVTTADGPNFVEFDISAGLWEKLRGVVGVELVPEERTTPWRLRNTKVSFVVKGDGKELYRSTPVTYESGPQGLEVSVKGIEVLRLELQNGSPLVDAVASVDWADLRLERWLAVGSAGGAQRCQQVKVCTPGARGGQS